MSEYLKLKMFWNGQNLQFLNLGREFQSTMVDGKECRYEDDCVWWSCDMK